MLIDAGMCAVRLYFEDQTGHPVKRLEVPSGQDLQPVLDGLRAELPAGPDSILVVGTLRDVIRRLLGRGTGILPAAALWAAAQDQARGRGLAVISVSASGYCAVGVNPDGTLRDNLLAQHARCGAGSGVNLDRILQKLNLARDRVDEVLARYLGEAGQNERLKIKIRSDRCGVFASSATVSDKNQGIPIDYALAVTLKSEVHKVCKLIPPGFTAALLTGGVFAWRFARDCAHDYLTGAGITDIEHDAEGILPILGLSRLAAHRRDPNRAGQARLGHRARPLAAAPGLLAVRDELAGRHLFTRLPAKPREPAALAGLKSGPVYLALDVGSTMAKLVVSDGREPGFEYLASRTNAGDTVATIKSLFLDLITQGVNTLNILGIGITGSARYQVKKVLAAVYPALADRIELLVENFAHAHGSLELVRQHVARLRANGAAPVNERFCLLVDVGGEDTKISTISLDRSELFDNAMNQKCSAGTGSLMDTMAALFGLSEVAAAADLALRAPKSYCINATCSVFLMENARALQAAGIARDEILASATWAVVDNMARSLWPQIELPRNAVALLHGQTMLSDALPVAIASRLQTVTGSNTYALVPPAPGHRACLGLIRSLAAKTSGPAVPVHLADFTLRTYEKTIIECRGLACGEPSARCSRSRLAGRTADNSPFSIVLGGCSAVNERATGRSPLQGRQATTQAAPIPDGRLAHDTYGRILDLAGRDLPRSSAADRLVIPKSLAVSEWAFFLAQLFLPFGIPVHIDPVREQDIVEARPHFRIDTCAPHVGLVGQMQRLGREPHKVILAPQLEFLPVAGNSLGRSCTVNQGAFATAKALAETESPACRIHLFHADLRQIRADLAGLGHKLLPRLAPVYALYGLTLTYESFVETVKNAFHAHIELKKRVADEAARLAAEAQADGRDLVLLIGREYVFNPGIYDSHIGKLLRDKNFAGIPAHVVDIACHPDFEHLYWRNSHVFASLISAAAQGRLHAIAVHDGFRAVFARVESGGRQVPVVQVSTFLCGPDSVTNPLFDELVKNRPFLRIQSDAIIKELAHLENRMNTFATQLRLGLHAELHVGTANDFDIVELKDFVNQETISRDRDAIYFPTLSDNRLLTAAIRAGGYTCIDNYDEAHELETAVRRGRAMVGDAVCTPLAAVYGDILNAIDDFRQRKQAGDPLVADKKRLLIFNNKGQGPCRQGQYVETHKVFLKRSEFTTGENADLADSLLRFLVGHENRGFNVGFPQWVFLRAIQSVILQGVLHQVLAAGAARCADEAEYQEFLTAYQDLKSELGKILEHRLTVSADRLATVRRLSAVGGLGPLAKFFGYRFHENPLTGPLRRFADRWCRRPLPAGAIRIHIDGEVYMRTAQFEQINRSLLAILGFGRFELTYAPVWAFLEYKLAGALMRAREGMQESLAEFRQSGSAEFRKQRWRFGRKKAGQFLKMRLSLLGLRQILATPLYRAAGQRLPEPITGALARARDLVPTCRPGGELMPFVGETLLKLEHGYDLIINVGPEGCMVSSMGEVMAKALRHAVPEAPGKVEPLFSQQGDVDEEALELILLKTLGPARLYQGAED